MALGAGLIAAEPWRGRLPPLLDMRDRQLVGPVAESTPAELRTPLPAGTGLPDDLLREASGRLGIASLLAGALWVVGTITGHVAAEAMTDQPLGWPGLGTLDAIAAVSVVVSLGLFAYSRRPDRDPRFVLDLGLAYLVFTGVALAVLAHWGAPVIETQIQPMISWTGVAMIMFAVIVPNRPGKIFLASLLAASMNPLQMLLQHWRGAWDFGSPWNALLMHYPDFILVGVAVVLSRVVTRLGRQLAKAREMGSYRLGTLLGRGGMGEVYTATHRMLARPAAIKLIRPEVLAAHDAGAAQLAIARFRREAEAAASLRSPHTVELYDFGVTDDQTLYFVMELLDGLDLETLVRQYGSMPAGRAIYLLRQVCESLEEAHARGLVHRDIKPANIHVGRLGLRHDFVKVLDFGLVKSVAASQGETSLATDAGLTPGTPAYMAPEMASGDAVDGRADLYALGCVAYYMLTGRLVFEVGGALAMVAKHLREPPVPPSQRAGRPIPEALDQLVLALLAKSPADRPASAAELSRALGTVEVTPWGEAEAASWWGIRQRGEV